MDYRPSFRREPSLSELTLQPSRDASRLAQAYRRKGSAVACQVKMPDRVREEAKARVLQAGGDPTCCQLVLSESELQFGQYRGQTFKWLLSHDVGYTCSLLVSHQKEREGGDTSQSPLAANKDALASYAQLFPEMTAVIRQRRMREGSLSVRGMDNTLVGFGAHAGETYRSLYESTSSESRTYLQWVRKQKVYAGSRMHTLQVYVLGRDNEVAAAKPSAAPPARQTAPQPPSSAASTDPSDDMLLAAAMLVDSQLDRDAPPAVTAPGPSVTGPSLPAVPPAGDGPGQPAHPASASGAQLLPKSWRMTLPEEQQDWLGRALFTRGTGGQPVLTADLRLWWFPPGDRPLYTQPPATAHAFFHSRFFLWVPYRMWAYKLVCPTCGRKLTGAGLYKTVRRVLDMSSWYFMGTEYLECCSCHRKYAAWAQDILGQLDLAHQERFPAVLTYKLSCDKTVIGMLKERTLGNSASRLRAALVEQHTREWMGRSMSYLSVLRKLRVSGAAPQRRVSLPPMHPVPSVSWLLSVYVRDVLTRLDETKARVTSIFGVILKMDSTKKMTKKLAGDAAGTAAWVTNVGNEHGQVLMSVLTESEGNGLLPMAAGLVRRYTIAGKTPPQVLYVDRDCCSAAGQCKAAAMFSGWDQLVVRLDVWHLMRRFARGVTTDSHQLYGLFMARLSFAIFEWDSGDVDRLTEAKQSEEGRDAHITLSARELARHCRRRTRGAQETERLIQEVLDSFWAAADTMGVPLIDRARMEEIWSTQRRHLHCIQDPPGVELYTKTGEVTGGGSGSPSSAVPEAPLPWNRFTSTCADSF
ncbi:uncharacterized protein LOC122863319 [Siniperca chuatsi]|uniref:uncharacterized protein LOC122863319 n=1 Tax=Siniperca chuatsi TaxID=119488 RepID=UPI001CE0B77C|nr:uncharacterized protein LOC122863319 [Siniperca chuatsi]XP_044025645.1 uncharacterized protein LOC122863319 [Siniperca chuatsi]